MIRIEKLMSIISINTALDTFVWDVSPQIDVQSENETVSSTIPTNQSRID